MRKSQKTPRDWEVYLWSAKIEDVDLEKHKVYVIHQILAWGEPEDIKKLFKIYGFEEVRSTFIKHPKKVYTPQAFNFIVKIVLEAEKDVNPKDYISRIT